MRAYKNMKFWVLRPMGLLLALSMVLPLWGCGTEESVPSSSPVATQQTIPSYPPELWENDSNVAWFPDTYDYFQQATIDTILAFANEHGLEFTDWLPEVVDLLDKNPDTREYVLNYPFNKDKEYEIDLSDLVGSDTMPLLLQWDERWGYTEYAGELMAISGCGPTTLSMVCLYLLDDPTLTPKYIAEFAEARGYGVKGNGSSWTLISKGGKELGLDVTEIPLDENRIIRNLNAGNPIIIVVGPGLFTTTGHFLVITGYEDGYVTVNDPNSPTKTAQHWLLTDVMKDIKNLWVCR